MSADEIIARYRRLPSEVPATGRQYVRFDRIAALPPASGTSIALLPWYRRILAYTRLEFSAFRSRFSQP